MKQSLLFLMITVFSSLSFGKAICVFKHRNVLAEPVINEEKDIVLSENQDDTVKTIGGYTIEIAIDQTLSKEIRRVSVTDVKSRFSSESWPASEQAHINVILSSSSGDSGEVECLQTQYLKE